jgi:xanthine dehydrogenase accessory factor
VAAIEDFLTGLGTQGAVWVTVQSHRGSVPREEGAWMAVFADALVGTIGGGHLEWQAVTEAKSGLLGNLPPAVWRYALGPTLGQCCGGEVELRFELVDARDIPRLEQHFRRLQANLPQVALFGGGHVGQALVRVLGTLPMQVRWIDSRDEIFPAELPANVCCEHSQPVQGAVPALAAQSHVLIMSFSHAEDLDVVAACLMRQRGHADLPFIGLIGSRTKWATFGHRLAARGFGDSELAQVTCPIGVSGIVGKEPEVIAVAVAAQLLRAIDSSDAGRLQALSSTDFKEK